MPKLSSTQALGRAAAVESVRAAAAPLSATQWTICIIAAIGFAFDSYELLALPLIVRPALLELLAASPGSPEFIGWAGNLYYVPAVCGGVFGLLGGYLTDRFGRRRVLLWSIQVYGFSALASAFATSPLELLVLRSITFVGVCVEFVAAVAWLAELFPEAAQRERVLGYTQAFASLGGLMVSAAYYCAVTWAHWLPEIRGGHEPWRYVLVSGVIPAIPLMIVRPFMPESPLWQAKKQAGTLRRPSFRELFQPALRRTTVISTAMVAFVYASMYGALLQVPRIVPGLADVRELTRTAQEQAVGAVQMLQEVGGLTGRVMLALLAVRIVSRRRLLRVFQGPSLVVVPLVFLLASTADLELVRWAVFGAGVLTVAQFSYWGNYLPRAFPTHLRGTGESFAANVGGRMIGTSGALVTTQLATVMPGGDPVTQLTYAAALVGSAMCVAGYATSFFLAEPSTADLPD